MKAPKPKTKKPLKDGIQKLAEFELRHLTREIALATVGHELSWKVFHGVDFAAVLAARGPQTRLKALREAVAGVIRSEGWAHCSWG